MSATAHPPRRRVGLAGPAILLAVLLVGCSTGPSEPGEVASPTATALSPGPAGSPTRAGSTGAGPVGASPTPSASTAAPAPAFCGSEVTAAELTACWRRVLPAVEAVMAPMTTGSGGRWSSPRMAVFGTKPPKNPCEAGGDGGVAGSFYCAQDRTLYLSTFDAGAVTVDYVREARKVPGVLAADAEAAGVSQARLRKGLTGQGQATILTHELAHQVLVQTGYQKWFDVRVEKYEPGSKRYDAYGFAPETAADCLTGAALREAKRRGLLRMNAFDLWGSRAWLAQTDGFNRERPLGHPFRYRNEWKGEQYRGYGGAYWRLRAFDLGWRTSAPDAVTVCTRAAAEWKGITATPAPVR